MALFDQWPYVNIHNLNTDWLVKTVKAVKDLAETIQEKTDDIDDSVTRARDSAANAKISEDNAKASEDAAKDYYDLTSVLVGKPLSANLRADMTDTTTIYIYTGSEPGMTPGDWYYYNGSTWVDGGKYGGDGGINDSARNLLLYILNRVAYTETGMDVYINALYEELAKDGSVTANYTITNALSHVNTSNSATVINDGDSYNATLTAETNYIIDAVTVTMDNINITSTAYDSSTGVISIANVTGDLVITATATLVLVYYDYLQGDGTAFIDTGLLGKTYAGDGYKKYCKLEIGDSEVDKAIFGIRNQWGTSGVQAGTGSAGFAICFGNAWNTITGKTLGDLLEFTLDYPNILVSNQQYLTVSGTTPTITSNTTTISLFGGTTSSRPTAGTYAERNGGYVNQFSHHKLYRFTLTEKATDTVIADMRPVTYLGVPGMYDVVREQFYPNANSSGSFTVGNDGE